MNDDEFLAAFEGCTVPRDEWTHAAHVRMAWIYLNRASDFEDALTKIREGIQRLNGSFGASPNKYHDTITIAYAALIRERIERHPDIARWVDFESAFPETLDWTSPLPLRHYSRDRLFCRAAHEAFIEPDLTPLPVLRVSSVE